MNSTRLESLYGKALCLYPSEFRVNYGSAMRQSLRDALSDGDGKRRDFIWILIRDLTTSVLKEHFSMLRETYLRPALIFNALVLTGIATVLALALYVIPQQVLRLGANDPQVEMAENMVQSLKSGMPVDDAAFIANAHGTQKKMSFLITSDLAHVQAKDVQGNSTELMPPPNAELPPLPPKPASRDAVTISDMRQQLRTMSLRKDDAHAKGSEKTALTQVEPLPPGTTLELDDNVAINDTIDVAQSLSPFLITYDAQGNAISSRAKLNGTIPTPPKGVFNDVRTKGEDRFTWQPQAGVRLATVVIHVQASGNVKEGFVLAARSMREVQARIQHIGEIALLAWLGMMGLILVGIVAFGWFTRPRIQVTAG